MRTKTSTLSSAPSLMNEFAGRMAEAMAVRRAELDAKSARAEAELLIRTRSEFLANMNHELRTPLNAIIGFGGMLKDQETYPLTDEQRANYAEYILQSADLLLHHINTLLEAAALDSGELAMAPEALDLGEALNAAIARARVFAEAKKVQFETKDGGGAECFGDTTRLGQAIDHVLRTAVKSSPEGAKVLVRAARDENGWSEIAVRDRGAGLSPEALQQALAAFSELHRGLDRSFTGPGIGLAIAKTFVELQGGRFSIKSRVGEGTLVRIAIPPPKAAARDAEERLAG
jgi:two-component system cell cycle sensor histidine kinase PleC